MPNFVKYLLVLIGLLAGCTFPTVNNYYVYEIPQPTASETQDSADESLDSAADTATETVTGVDWQDTCLSSGDFSNALFADDNSPDGLKFYFEISEEERLLMFNNWLESQGYAFEGYYVYDTEGENGPEPAYADLYLVDQFGICYVFGKVEVAIIGQSTGCELGADGCIAPLRLDSDEFQDGLRIGAEEKEHLAFHPGTISYIASEPTTLEILKRIGEPVPDTSLVWVGSNLYGEDVWIPYVMSERYDQEWLADHADQLGGDSRGLWEGSPLNESDGECEFDEDECDSVAELLAAQALSAIGYTDSITDTYVEESSPYIDHRAVQRQLCYSWILWIGDDAFHNRNNIEKLYTEDLRYLYYSVDLSVGANNWYTYTTLFGWDWYSNRCSDSGDCREEALFICEEGIAEYQATDPVGIIQDFCGRLSELGMMRPGDEEECIRIEGWHAARTEELEAELECWRAQFVYYPPGDSGLAFDSDIAGKGGGWDSGSGGGSSGCEYMMAEYGY